MFTTGTAIRPKRFSFLFSPIKMESHIHPEQAGNDHDTNMKLCFLCQDVHSKKKLRSSTSGGKEKLWRVADDRKQLQDDKWHMFLRRLFTYTREDFLELPAIWHKDCYSSFTSDQKLEWLKQKRQTEDDPQPSTSGSSPAKRRSLVVKMNWKLCMFCQSQKMISTRAVTYLETSNKMIELSRGDEQMRTRLSGVSDLIAAEGIYHLDCWAKFPKKVKDETSDICKVDTCINTICNELTEGLEKGNILYEMTSVWEKYCELCLASDFEIPQMYLSRRKTFYENVQNFKLWSTYMAMVETLFSFIRAEREGNWPLHLEAFAAMLPWITIYDHYNYARWGPVYLAEMKNLETTAPVVYSEFMAGNFVVKWGKGSFNQVSADHATEWVNRMCKAHNGIIGITRRDQARDKFCIT